jgi:hypothetical protein
VATFPIFLNSLVTLANHLQTKTLNVFVYEVLSGAAFTCWLHHNKHLHLTSLAWLLEHMFKHSLGFRHICDIPESSLSAQETGSGFHGSDICPLQGTALSPGQPHE